MAGPSDMTAAAQVMLQATSLDQTIHFYGEGLGFSVEGTWPDVEPIWCALSSGPARLMFTSDAAEDSLAPSLTGSLYFYPEDVDAFYASLPEWVETLTSPRDEPWGMREFALEDPNGYLLKFGRRLQA